MIVSINPGPKSVIFLVYCILSLFNYMLCLCCSLPLCDICHTLVAICAESVVKQYAHIQTMLQCVWSSSYKSTARLPEPCLSVCVHCTWDTRNHRFCHKTWQSSIVCGRFHVQYVLSTSRFAAQWNFGEFASRSSVRWDDFRCWNCCRKYNRLR